MSLVGDLRRDTGRVAVEAVLAAAGFAVALAVDEPVHAAAIIAAGYTLRLVVAADRVVRVWFVVGGLVWAGADVAFVRAGVFGYRIETWLGPPWYMPLLFGQLAVVTGSAMAAFGDREGGRVPLWVDGLVLAAATGAVIAFYRTGYTALAIAFPIALVARAAATGFELRATVAAAVVGTVEPAIELALIRAELFAFAEPGPWGLPIWYYAYFALASYAIRRAFVWSDERLRGRAITVAPSAG